jgi:hypothetical protein
MKMADYIRRDIVLKIINTVNDTGGFAGYADYCVLFDEIDTMPAANVQPIIYAHKTINVGRRSYCSNCGKLAIMEDFCSKCGAKVNDGDTNGLS